MTVMTVRMPEDEIEAIDTLSEAEHVHRSTMVRKLVRHGKQYLAIRKYEKGDASLSQAAKIADKNIADMIELLADLGIDNPLETYDYLDGRDTAEELIS